MDEFAVLDECLSDDVGGEDMLGDGVEQCVLVLEERVDGRRLHDCRAGGLAGADDIGAAVGKVINNLAFELIYTPVPLTPKVARTTTTETNEPQINRGSSVTSDATSV
jgi:hypothetical protein